MKNKIIVIGKCTEDKIQNEFHFLGIFKGEKVEKIILIDGFFERGTHYVLELEVIFYENFTLYCRPLSSRAVF